MRYALAGVLIVVGLITGLIGVAQKTIWAPDDQIVAQADLGDPGSVVVIEPGVLNLYDGAADLKVEHEGPISIARASKENVDAWVDSAAHTKVTGVKSETELRTEKVDGDEETPAVNDADLFTSVESGDSELSMHWEEDPGRTAFVVSSDGKTQVDGKLSISWPNPASTPWAIPLMVIGAILIILGIVLAFLANRTARREKERRKKRAERRRKLAQMGTAFVIVPGLALAGCSGPELPEPEPEEAPESPGGVISDDQLNSILERISSTVSGADEKNDTKALEERATGPFLEQRKAAYDIKKKDKDFKLPPALATQSVKVNFTSATDTWPRVTSAVTFDEKTNQTQVLVLSQESPRDNYKVWAQAVMLGGSEFPSVNDSRQGSELLPPDADGLAMTPTDAVNTYIDILKNGGKAKNVKSFEDDPFRKQTADGQRKAAEALKDGNAEVKFEYSRGDELVAQRAADGSAMVVGSAVQKVTYSPEKVDDRKGQLSIDKPQSEIVGKKETDQNLTTEYRQVYAFIVPKGEGKARLIGLTSVLSGAKIEEGNDSNDEGNNDGGDNGGDGNDEGNNSDNEE